jgi:glycosyltransferase involved in cell wall biosynthesis
MIPSPNLRLLHVFSTFRVGGPQVRFAALANYFRKDVRNLIVAMDGDRTCRERLDPSLPVEFLCPAIRKGHTIENVRTFRRILRTNRPDVLVTYNWGSIEWAIANWPHLVRHVHVEDGFGPDEAEGQLRRRVWTRRLILSRSTIVVPSRNLETIATRTWRLDPRRVRYIPNGIDCARFSRSLDDPGSRVRWPGSGPVIGTVAALRREKNLARLLRAFHRVSKQHACRLVIVGDGPERATLQALSAALGISDHVVFAGHFASPDALYRSFDVFALSSDTEQMPYTIIEAMAAGLPIASTDVGDISYMVAAENRPFVVAGEEFLAEALGKLLEGVDVRRAIGIANRKKAQREFDQETMFAAYGALFRGYNPSPAGIGAHRTARDASAPGARDSASHYP